MPASLRDLPEPPTRLFVHGRVPRGPCVGIVGTRHPTAGARDYAVELAFQLARRGVAIVSGGAGGIDAAAHRGALDAGGSTLVVAPSSFDRPYPEKHGPLFAEVVARGGGYVSPYEVGVEPRRHQFFERNSYLVALSHALVVVEAPLRSGARNAALWARRLRRKCFVVPAVPWNSQGLGCIAELQLGGFPLASHEDVLRWLDERQLHAIPASGRVSHVAEAEGEAAPAPAIAPRRRRGGPAQSAGPGALEQAILQALRAGAQHPDQIGQMATLTSAEVSHGLLLLTLQGLVAMGDHGGITLAR